MAEDGYYENERADVARLVPPSARVILDAGCGKGNLGVLLKKQVPARRVFGIELFETAAAEAQRVLDGVVVGDLLSMGIPFERGFFDCMIFADVLEHLVDPAAVLRRLKPCLKNDGLIVCSIPNVRHYTAIMQLVLHGWDYAEFGLFDKTHLRFFSLRNLKDLMRDGGFVIEKAEPRIVASRKMKLLNAVCLGGLTEFAAIQYLVCARPSDQASIATD